MTPSEGALLFAAAAGAGAVNAVAGGGTLLSFPALLATGMDPRLANATSTFALWPGQFGGIAGYRGDLGGSRALLWKLGVPSLLGGALGGYLLWRTEEESFEALVPWLLLFAALLFAVSGPLARWFRKEAEAAESLPGIVGMAFQFLVAVYGGYFGAGAGILMLGAMAFLGMTDIHRMNGVKLCLAVLINGVAIAIFASKGMIFWPQGLLMAVGAASGGFLGATLARRVSRDLVRKVVIVVGLAVAAERFWQVHGG